jgi:MFS family permease
MTEATTPKNPMLRVLSLRDFRLLFGGAATSLLGDSFAFIAMPWLVLQLTGDPLVLGIVLALQGFPRAVFMLLGGAVTDRLSPRVIMIVSDTIRLVLTALMAFAIFTGAVQMWMLYAFALCFGLVAGFAIPAENSIIPVLVRPGDLQAGNSLMGSMTQLIGFVGPSIAGIVIGGYAHSLFGIGLAFAADAFSFAVSAACMLLIRGVGSPARPAGERAGASIWTSILEGLKFLWADSGLRLLFIIMLAMNFLLVGPLVVGIPVLADQRLPEGAVAFGLLMSAYSGGNLFGGLAAGALPRPSGRTVRLVLIGLALGFGVAFSVLSFVPSTWIDFALLFVLGIGNGYFGIILFTWIQAHTPRKLLGRMMSILSFGGMGLQPISQAVSGAVSKIDLNLLFIASGGLTLLLAAWAAFQPGLRTLSESMVSQPLANDPDSVAP